MNPENDPLGFFNKKKKKSPVKEDYAEKYILAYVSTLVVTISISIALAFYVFKPLSYHWFYKDLVKQTIVEMVDSKYLIE